MILLLKQDFKSGILLGRKYFYIGFILICFTLISTLLASLLAALAGVEHRLVTLQPAPARLAMAHRALSPVRLADAVHAVDFLAGLAAGDHARLHLCLGEVLELIVDVQVLDTAMETGAVLELPETENA